MSVLSELGRGLLRELEEEGGAGAEAVTKYPGRLCFCNYPHCAAANDSCLAQPDAACFHFIQVRHLLVSSLEGEG